MDQAYQAQMIGMFGRVIGAMMNWPPIHGRMLVSIMLSDTPLTAEELRDELGISAGSVSESTRSLIESGVVERVKISGSRRSVYRWRHDAWVGCATHTAHNFHPMRDLVQRTYADSARVGMSDLQCERFARMAEFYAYMCDTFDKFAEDVAVMFERSGQYVADN
jgi:DNA-binding transcriptional regulator GbsR (MarR family)